MMHRIVTSILDRLQKQGAISTEEEREICYYGLDLILFSVINIAVLLTLGGLAGHLLYTAILVFCVGWLQTNGGGFHAESHFRCFLCMLLMWIISMWVLSMAVTLGNIFFLCIGTVGTATVFLLAPMQNPNAPASLEKHIRSRGIVRNFSLLLFVAMLALMWLVPSLLNIAFCISISLAAYGVSLVAAKVKNLLVGNTVADAA